MQKQSPLSFRVQCSACFGAEVWRFERIARLLKEVGKMPPSESEIELIAREFIAHSKNILCPGCGKTGFITVQRIEPKT
jgi:hypothetical protein